MKWFKQHPILSGVLGLALVLRIVGITYGLPHFFVGDEESQLGASLVMLKTHNLIPAFSPANFKLLYYPAAMSYVYLLILLPALGVWMLLTGMGPAALAQKVVLDPTVPWLAGRILIVLCSLLSLVLVYQLGRRLFSKRVGILAAFFLGTSFLYLSLSEVTRHWVPTTFFEILAMIAALNIFEFGRRKDYIWGAIFAALSFGVGFIGAIAAFFPSIAHFARYRGRIFLGLRSKEFWLFVGTFVAILAVIIALYPQRFLSISGGADVSVAQVKTLGGFIGSFGYHFKTVLLADPIIFALGILGLFLAWKKRRGIALTFMVYAVLYISALYFLIHNEARYISFLYPGFVLSAALTADLFWEKLSAPTFVKITAALLLAIFLGYPLLVAGRFVWVLHRDDTRTVAEKWIGKNLEANQKILSFLAPEVLLPDKASIRLQQQLDPSSLRTIDRTLLSLPDNKYPKSHELLSWPKISNPAVGLMQTAQAFHPQYAVIQFWSSADYLKIPAGFKTSPAAQKITSGLGDESVDFMGNFDVSSSFVFQMQRLGPVIEIHKL